MNIINEIETACKVLDQVQEYAESLINQLSNVDSKICDLEHFVELNSIKNKGCYRIIQELKKCTIERRKIKNDMELSRVLNLNINKLINDKGREFLITELNKANSKLNKPYNNRVYNDEEMCYLLGKELYDIKTDNKQ